MSNIYILNDTVTLSFAASELSKYLKKITHSTVRQDFQVHLQNTYDKNLKGIWLTLEEDTNISFEVENPLLDDGIYISIEKGSGIIAGSNERSVLLGVYRFLTELGCRWVRPSIDGEILVTKQLQDMTVSLKETPSLRHRGIVIEGANTYANVRDMIEWMPKVGYNSYFIQFMYAYSFFKQWYSHANNPLKGEEPFDDNMAIEFTQNLIEEIKKRGLIFHSVGHGWTCETMGVEGRGWTPEEHDLDPKTQEFLALINGKREFYYNIPINTNLCYSSPLVQARFADSVVKYASQNKGADMIHVWVADDFNNHCECDHCAKLTPTDWYVQILNLIDEKLTQKGLNSKIAFLLYFELLWTPIQERLHNPERFVMMFAPISRTFTKSYQDIEETNEEIEPFNLNKVKLPQSVTLYVKFLKKWQNLFKGDSFDFDYHLGRAHYGDPGYYEISKIISKDIKSLHDLGLNGLMSCQQQRSFFPTGLPNYVMAQTLWNTDANFDEIADDYLSRMFGRDYDKCQNYLSDVSDSFDMDYWHLERGGINLRFAKQLKGLDNILDRFAPIVEKNLNNPLNNSTQATSWKYLHYHLKYTKLFGGALGAKASGNKELANTLWSEFAKYLCENEDELQKVLDVFRILSIGKHFNQFEVSM